MSCIPQINKGYEFESETDTEVIPKLIKYIYDNRESNGVTFSTLVEGVIRQLVSSSDTATHNLPTQLAGKSYFFCQLQFLFDFSSTLLYNFPVH